MYQAVSLAISYLVVDCGGLSQYMYMYTDLLLYVELFIIIMCSGNLNIRSLVCFVNSSFFFAMN